MPIQIIQLIHLKNVFFVDKKKLFKAGVVSQKKDYVLK